MDKLRRHMLIGGAIAGAGFGVNVFAAPEYLLGVGTASHSSPR